MATYGILSASKALSASTGNDTITMHGVGSTTLSAQTINGSDGNDVIDFGAFGKTAVATGTFTMKSTGGDALTGLVALNGSATYYATGKTANTGTITAVVTGVVTSQAGTISASKVVARGQLGDDTIIFGPKLKSLTASYIGGGKGNDYIGVGTFVNNQFTTGAADSFSGASAVATTIYGGAGRDTINIKGAGTITASEFLADADNDTLVIESASVTNSYIGAGKGNDAFSGTFTQLKSASLVGGQGQDTMVFNSVASGEKAFIAGDSTDRGASEGGADSIFISGKLYTGTIQGGAGNDSLTLNLLESSGNTIFMDAGNDVISAAITGDITDTTIRMGKGDDLFNAAKVTGAVIGSGAIYGGQGADTVAFNGAITGGEILGLTINGGAGADYLLADATLTGGDTAEAILQISTSTDSTISAFDTIVAGAASGGYVFNYEPGGVTRGTFSGNGVTATNGVVTFTGTFDNGVTARADYLNDNGGASGKTYAFSDGAGASYLFVKGSNNTVVQLGSANYSGGVGSMKTTDETRNYVDLG